MQIENALVDKFACTVENSICGSELIKMQGYDEFNHNIVSFDHQPSSREIGVQTTLASPTAKTSCSGLYESPV